MNTGADATSKFHAQFGSIGGYSPQYNRGVLYIKKIIGRAGDIACPSDWAITSILILLVRIVLVIQRPCPLNVS